MNLKKVYTIGSFKALETEGPGTFEAVVSVFGNVDLQGDRTMPGAFKTTLKEWRAKGDPIPVVWSHDWLNPEAHIGKIDPQNAVETSGGLLVKGVMDVHKPFAAQVYDLLKERRVKEWSFAYDTVKEKKAEDGANELFDLKLIECGPCLKGANPETYTVGTKAALETELTAAYEQGKRFHQFFDQIKTMEDPEIARMLTRTFFEGEADSRPTARYHVEKAGSKFAVIANTTDTAVAMLEREEEAVQHVVDLESGKTEPFKDMNGSIIDESQLEGPAAETEIEDGKAASKPWHIEERGDEFCVIKDDDNSTAGCHPTREAAEAQLRALYANESAEPEAEEKADEEKVIEPPVVTTTADTKTSTTSSNAVVSYITSTADDGTTFFTIGVPDGDKAGRVIGRRAAAQLKESIAATIDQFVTKVNGGEIEEEKTEEPVENKKEEETPSEYLNRLLGELE